MRKKNYYELNNIDLDKVYYFVPKGRGNSKKGDNTLNDFYGALGSKNFEKLMENVKAEAKTDT